MTPPIAHFLSAINNILQKEKREAQIKKKEKEQLASDKIKIKSNY